MVYQKPENYVRDFMDRVPAKLDTAVNERRLQLGVSECSLTIGTVRSYPKSAGHSFRREGGIVSETVFRYVKFSGEESKPGDF